MRLFISYAHVDVKKITRLAAVLRQNAHDVWFDERLVVGEDWQVRLRTEIERSDALVYVLTPASVTSEWCQWEFITAITLGKPIIPIMLERVDLPVVLQQRHYIDLTAGFRQKNVQRLLKDLNTVTIPPDQAPALPQNPAGQPARASQNVTLGSVQNSTISITQVVGDRHWSVPVALILLLSLIAATVAVLEFGIDVGVFSRSESIKPTVTPISLSKYNVGVVVTYFEPQQVETQLADTLVDQIYTSLLDDLTTFADEVDLTLGVLGPEVAGRIAGDQRDELAASMALQYDADVLLYGEITRDENNRWLVQPLFYVNPENFSDALEMTGSFRLGSPIEVDDDPTTLGNVMNVNRPLKSRMGAMVDIFAGLTYFALEDYDAALVAFQAALEKPNWKITDGKEVLHLLIANTYLKTASVATQHSDINTAQNRLDDAFGHLQTAHDLAPDYARALVGLAIVEYMQWNIDSQRGQSPGPVHLEHALEYLDAAQTTATDRTEHATILAKEVFVRLQVRVALWLFYRAQYGDLFGAVQDDVERILRLYDGGRNEPIQFLASEAYAMRGLVRQTACDCEAAVDDYHDAIQLSTSDLRRMFFYVWLGECYATLGESQNAIEAYKAALDLAEHTEMPASQIERYQQRLDDLRSGAGGKSSC